MNALETFVMFFTVIVLWGITSECVQGLYGDSEYWPTHAWWLYLLALALPFAWGILLVVKVVSPLL